MKVDWKNSEAKNILMNDLASGDISHAMSPREAWEMYEDSDEFEGVEFSQFSRNLISYRKKMMADPKFVLENSTAATGMIASDIENEILPAYEYEMSARDAWDTIYRDRKEFNNVPFWHFEEKLSELRQKKRAHFSQIQALKFQHEMSEHATKLLMEQARESYYHRKQWNGEW